LTGKCERAFDEGIESKFREICRDSGRFKSLAFMTGLSNSMGVGGVLSSEIKDYFYYKKEI
jgi:hypothetical protein